MSLLMRNWPLFRSLRLVAQEIESAPAHGKAATRQKTRRAILAAMVLIATLASAASPVRAQEQNGTEEAETLTASQQAVVNELQKMTWFKDTTLTLPESHAKLVIPNKNSAILGRDAKRLDEIINGKSGKSEFEAAVLSSDLKYHVNFAFFDSGYVDESDWGTLKPTELLQSVIDATEEANKERRAEGLPEMHVVKWLLEPTQDKRTHTVYWAIEGRDSNGSDVVNSIAIRLGRAGFEKLTLITAVDDYQPEGGPLDLMLRAFSFPAGATYEEHISTDKSAGYGIAALIGAVAGAKALKVAAAGGLTLFFKPIMAFFVALIGKAWVLLLLPFIWLRSLFKGRPKKQKSANETPPLTTDDSTQD